MKRKTWQTDSDFFAGLSHEVRQPLNGVVEKLHLLLGREFNEREKNLIRLLLHHAHGLVAAVNDILDLIRLQEGNFYLAQETFDLQDVLDSVERQLREILKPAGIDFNLLLHPDAPAQMTGDPGRLRQALKAMALLGSPRVLAPEASLLASVEEESETTLKLHFTIQTRLESALAARLEYLVDLSGDDFALDRLLAEEPTETGLRLALVRKLADLLDGEFGAAAGEESGITIWLTAAFAKQSVLSERHAGDLRVLRDLPVLLFAEVEEDAANPVAWLAEWGCRVTRLPRLAEGLPALREARAAGRPFQVVLLVNRASGQEAEDFGRAVKGDPECGDVGLALVTATGRQGDVPRLREIGFAAYLTDPLEPEQLRQALALVAERVLHHEDRRAIVTRHYLREMKRRALRIGVVEDNPVHQMMVLLLLEKLGHRGAAWRREDLPPEPEVDLLLLDAESEIPRRLPETVTLIGMAKAAVGRERPAGFACLMNKPVNAASLRAVVDWYLERRPADGEPAPAPVAGPAFHVGSLLANFDHDVEMVREVTEFFQTEFSRNLEALKEALAAGQAERRTELLEEMKDAAGSMEIKPLWEILADLERALRHNDEVLAGALLGRLERSYREIARLFAEI